MAIPVDARVQHGALRAGVRRLTLVVVMTAGLGFWNVAPAVACSCLSMDRNTMVQRSDVVFTALVIEKRVSRQTFSSADPAVWVLEVDAVYKGSVAARQGVVSERNGASCGLELTPGSKAVVFAFREPRSSMPNWGGTLFSGLCDGSKSIVSAAEITAELGQARPPEPGVSGVDIGPFRGRRPWMSVAAGMAAVVVVAAGARALRRRSSGPVS